jgi:hypothetical protein
MKHSVRGFGVTLHAGRGRGVEKNSSQVANALTSLGSITQHKKNKQNRVKMKEQNSNSNLTEKEQTGARGTAADRPKLR